MHQSDCGCRRRRWRSPSYGGRSVIGTSSPRRLDSFAPFYALERIGRIAMDFGLGAYLEKFEEHFGPFWTRAMLTIVGFAIVVACGSVIYTNLISPALKGLGEIPPKPHSGTFYTLSAIWWVIVIVFALTTILMSIHTRQTDVQIRYAREAIEHANALAIEAKTSLDAVNAAIGQGITDKMAAMFILEDVILAATQDGLILPEQAEWLRSLLDTEPEKPL